MNLVKVIKILKVYFNFLIVQVLKATMKHHNYYFQSYIKFAFQFFQNLKFLYIYVNIRVFHHIYFGRKSNLNYLRLNDLLEMKSMSLHFLNFYLNVDYL